MISRTPAPDLRRIRRPLAGAVMAAALGAAGPALSQSAASRIDQPTPATVAPTPERDGAGRVSPPGAIRSSTDVIQSDGTVQGGAGSNRTNPIQHLPETMR